MVAEACIVKELKGLGFLERYLTVWVPFCIGAGIFLGKAAPEVARSLDVEVARYNPTQQYDAFVSNPNVVKTVNERGSGSR